ncbi:unnamed protein product [Cyprideis torosa]|uniref:Uncharacterized protein n=1 Tax=Cyprideis torosa TaxID=163714 RepID=A0A7R8W7U6_9CRUS|nr:unnamed protein product [Cyprideis torosa]CAG0883065.1 unnamed protein product [Cyprideis torosa]
MKMMRLWNPGANILRKYTPLDLDLGFPSIFLVQSSNRSLFGQTIRRLVCLTNCLKLPAAGEKFGVRGEILASKSLAEGVLSQWISGIIAEKIAIGNPSKRIQQQLRKLHLYQRPEETPLPTHSLNTQTLQCQATKGPVFREQTAPPPLHSKPTAQKPADSAKPFSHYIESTFVKECLVWHNLFRSRHNAPALALSPQLCASAQEWANFLARSDTFQYQNAKQIGENLLCRAMIHQSFGDVNGREVAVVWYSDVRKYDFNKRPDLLHVQAGSFTQMIWKTTKCFGIARARTKKSNKLFIVAHYYPKGNIPGRFHKEVLPVRRLEEESGSGQPERKRDRSPALGAIGYITSTFSLFAKTRDASSDGSRST